MTIARDKIRNLPPDKLDFLLRQLRPKTMPAGEAAARTRPFRAAEDQNFSLVVKRPGILESLAFRTQPRFSATAADPAFVLHPHEVEVEIHAAGLNFRDVAVALGMYPTPPGQPPPLLGCDGAGVVAAVGREVTRFKVGDEVACLSGKSTFSRYTCATEAQVFHKPRHLTFEEAAGLPLAFVTAHYGLIGLGRLWPGERVLIHSAAGGVGLAAVQIAQMIGAEILATVGTAEKREYLRSLGIRHIMDSRSLTFAGEVRNLTGGEGVDVILNSLTGDAIAEGIALLRQDGRFVELGKRDLAPGRSLDLEPFRKGLSFIAMDTSRLNRRQQQTIGQVIDELSQHFHAGRLQPLPIQTFPVSRLADTFRYMTQGKHIGKFVIQMQGEPVMIESAV